MPWPPKRVPQSDVDARRAEVVKLRAQGMRWTDIASTTDCRTPHHARIDWIRAMEKKELPQPLVRV